MHLFPCEAYTINYNLISNHEISQHFALTLDYSATKRLNDGTNAAAELFQHTLQQTLQGIKGIKNIADDIIVFGNIREDYDRALEEFLTR